MCGFNVRVNLLWCGKGGGVAGLVVEVVVLAAFEVAVMPRWIPLRTSGVGTEAFDRKVRVMPVLIEAMATEVVEIEGGTSFQNGLS